MLPKKGKNNRKTININRSQDNCAPVSLKEQVLHQFDSVFHSNLHQYIEMERNNLKSLDKRIAKRVVSAAQNNLLHFLKSRAKIYCLRSQQNVHPFHIGHQQKTITKHQLFDSNKLHHELQKEQKPKKAKTIEYSPLFERCLRQTAQTLQNRASEEIQKPKFSPKKQLSYIPLSAHNRKRKFIF